MGGSFNQLNAHGYIFHCQFSLLVCKLLDAYRLSHCEMSDNGSNGSDGKKGMPQGSRTLKSLLSSRHSFNSQTSDGSGSGGSWSDSSISQFNRLSEFRGDWAFFEHWSTFRLMCYDISESKLFGGFILFIIGVNTTLIALQTDSAMHMKGGAYCIIQQRFDSSLPYLHIARSAYGLTCISDTGFYFAILDAIFLGIYVFELALKLFVWRRAFFVSGWNKFGMRHHQSHKQCIKLV